MAAHTPEDVDRLFVEALNAGKIDDLVALSEPEATRMASPGKLVKGTAAIRESLKQFIDAKPNMALQPRLVAQTADLAMIGSNWELAMTGPDGKPAQMKGESVEVVRRQADGRWLFAIDLPFGPGA